MKNVRIWVTSGGVLGLALTALLFQNCGGSLSSSSGQTTTQQSTGPMITKDQCAFSGIVLETGTSVIAYQSELPPAGKKCSEISEVRDCKFGSLSGSFPSRKCTDSNAASCSLIGGTSSIPGSNGQAMAYENQIVPFGSSCVSGTVSCNNGVLSGSTYRYASCQVQGALSCSFDGKSVPHGGTVTAFSASTVPSGQTCQPETRTCNNGILSGNASFPACTVNAAPACTLDGATVASGQARVFYRTPQNGAYFNGTCESYGRQCVNGVLTGDTTYDKANCPAPTSCEIAVQRGANTHKFKGRYDSAIGQCIYQVCKNESECGSVLGSIHMVDGRHPFDFGNAQNICARFHPTMNLEFYNIIRKTISPNCGWDLTLIQPAGIPGEFTTPKLPLCLLRLDTGVPVISQVWCSAQLPLPTGSAGTVGYENISPPVMVNGYYTPDLPYDKDPHDNNDGRYCQGGIANWSPTLKTCCPGGVNADGTCFEDHG